MNDILDPREELAIQLALEQLAVGDPARQAIAGSPDPDVPVREYVELFGLLAQSLEPAEPRPELQARILAQIAAATLQPLTRPPAPAVLAHPEPKLVDDMTLIKTLRRQPAEAAELGRAAARRSRWPALAMAATLGGCLVGMGWLAWQLDQHQATIAQLTQQLETTGRGAAEVRLRIEATQSRFETARRRLEMVTTTARRVYALHPREATATPEAPHGVIFVCGMHQQWYMSLQNLAPPAPGQQYFLWFLDAANQPLEGRAIELEGTNAELDARSMPYGTRAFMVTLEPTGNGGRPEGAVVILGDKPIAL